MRKLFWACLILTGTGASVPCFGATIHVYDGQSIQAAINSSSNGDTVLVHNGSYQADPADNSRIFFKGKAITLRSENGADSTFIYSAELKIDEGETSSSRIEGFTFKLLEGPHWEHGIRCDSSSPTITRCTFLDNISGIGCFDGASPNISDCQFIGNGHYDWVGGGVTCRDSDPTIQDCYFYGNLAGEGGAIYCESEGATPTVTNCLFARNGSRDTANYQITWNGGAVDVEGGAHPRFENCTFVDNFAESGSAVCLFGTSSITLEKCIIAFGVSTAGSPAVRCAAFSSATASLSCCDVFGNDGGDWADCIADQGSINGNLSLDPLFCDTAGSHFGLTEYSPCLPDNNSCTSLIGALGEDCEEYNGPYWHITVTGSDVTGDGSQENPFATIQHAIDVSSTGHHILVHDGTFEGFGNRNIDFHNKRIIVESQNGPDFTIIECDSLRGFIFDSGEDSLSVVRGLQITEASEEAFWCDGSSPTIEDCIITGNIRGITCRDSASPIIRSCIISDNERPDDYNGGGYGVGGGLHCIWGLVPGTESSPRVEDCVFLENRASAGAAVYCWQSQPTFTNCLFLRNGYPDTSTSAGAAVFVSDGPGPVMTNCTFAKNISSTGSVVAVQLEASIEFERCIMAFNQVRLASGRVAYCQNNGDVDLQYCDVYGNSSGDFDGCIADESDIDGNFSAPPFFCDTAADDYSLRGHSSCVTNHSLNTSGGFIGAYQVGCVGPYWIVATDGDDLTGDGTYAAPYGTIQYGMDQCPEEDTVLLRKGTFYGIENYDLDFAGKAIVVTTENGPDSTTLDVDLRAHGFELDAGEDSLTVIDGLTISFAAEGGVSCSGASPTISDCVFFMNGLAVDLREGADAHIKDCRFLRNRHLSSSEAAGISCRFSSPTVENCRFEENATNAGGAVYCAGNTAVPTFSNCVFIRNGLDLYQTSHGAAVEAFYYAHPYFVNCTFFDNQSVWGPAVHTQDAEVTIERSIIAFNRDGAFLGGGPVECLGYSDEVDINCCNVFGNLGGDFRDCLGDEEYHDDNFSANPLFCDTAAGDLHLAENSLCLAAYSDCGELVGAFGFGCAPVSNTPAGEDVPVSPMTGVEMTFDEITGEGNTDAIVQTGGPPPPEGFATVPSDPTTYYNITSTATYSGQIEICIAYDEADLAGRESGLTLQHFDGAEWVDITSDRDPINNIICGLTGTLSPFVMAVDTGDNVPPGAFTRLAPVDSSTVSATPVEFNWTRSIDPDGDSVWYELSLTVNAAETTLNVGDTAVALDLSPLVLPLGSWDVTWEVLAFDGEDTTTASNGEGLFTLDLTTGVDDPAVDNLPTQFALRQNYPNPFNPATAIAYDVPRRSYVSIRVYNLLGREVRVLVQEEVPAGFHSIAWNGTDNRGRSVASGIYLYRIRAGDYVATRKMMLLK